MRNDRNKNFIFIGVVVLIGILILGCSKISDLDVAETSDADIAETSATDAAKTSVTQTSITISPDEQYQVHEGFGTSLTWWANEIGGWPEPQRSEITKLIFDPVDGLGVNIVRYNIGGSAADQPDMRDGGLVRSDINEDGTYDWTVDANQRWILQAAKDYAGDDFIADAFSTSPPMVHDRHRAVQR